MKRSFDDMNLEIMPNYYENMIDWILNFDKNLSDKNIDTYIYFDDIECNDDIDSDNIIYWLNKYIKDGLVINKKTEDQLHLFYSYKNNKFNIRMMSKSNIYKINCKCIN